VEKNEDRRVRKTKKALREALISLLNEKSLQNITVRELTSRADIHRSTFYANFEDIYALYAHTEESIAAEISDLAGMSATQFFGGLISYVNENRQTARLFLTSADFSARLTSIFADSCAECWRNEYGVTTAPAEMEYHIQFCLSGAIGAVAKWVAEDFKYPAEELAAHLADLDAAVANSVGPRKFAPTKTYR